MFDLWRKIAEKGAVAVPVRAEALSALGWVEVGEEYHELVPDKFRGYDIYSDSQLIRESPFRLTDGCPKFDLAVCNCGVDLAFHVDIRELIEFAGAKDYHADFSISFLAGVLTCSCGSPACAGIDSQTFHVSEKMVHWAICLSGAEHELFFEREAYEVGMLKMFGAVLEHENPNIGFEGGGGYTSKASFKEGLRMLFVGHPYFSDMWDEIDLPRI